MTIALVQREDIPLRYLASSQQEHDAVTKLTEHEGVVGQNEENSILKYFEIIY